MTRMHWLGALGAALVMGSSLTAAPGIASGSTKPQLTAKASSDITTLAARMGAVTADLKSLQKLAKSGSVASIAARLKSDEAAESTAETALSADLTGTRTTPTTAGSSVEATLLTQSGSGIASTQQFTVPKAAKGWHLNWTYDCSSFGSSGNFDYTVNTGTTPNFNDSGPNQLGAGGSGVEHYYDTGTFNLSVNSECAWTVTAVSGS